jgi:arylsulfatase A-like enzyme
LEPVTASLARARREALLWGAASTSLVLVELAVRKAPVVALALTGALALGLALAAGGLFGFASAWLARGSELRRVLAGLAVGGGGCWVQLDALGVGPELRRHNRQALLALLVCVSLGLGVALMLWAYWRVTREPRRTPARTTVGVLLLLVATAAVAVDWILPADLHVPTHAVLAWAAFAAVGLAASSLWLRDAPGGLVSGLLLAGALAGALPWLLPWPAAAAHGTLAAPVPAALLRFARRITDWDGDGYSSQFAHGDCAGLNAAVAPGVLDVPGDGVDQDCSGADRRAEEPAPGTAAARPTEPTGVVLITIDTLRADRVGRAGPDDPTPALSAWARHAVRFERAYTAGGWTALALPSLMRGEYPRRLAWTHLDETTSSHLLRRAEPRAPGEVRKRVLGLPLAEPRPSLQALLKADGVRAGAVVDDGFSGYLSARTGAFRDFDPHVELTALRHGPRGDAGTTDAAIAVIDQLAAAPRFFLWVHYFGPHAPTTWHPEIPRRGTSTADAYDHEVRFADLQVGRLLAHVTALQPAHAMAVIVTADHGEALGRLERHHGNALDDATVAVPLLLATPGEPGGRVSPAVVSSVDVMPTVLGLLGVAAPPGLDGVDLRRSAAGQAPPDRVVISETWRFDRDARRFADQVAAISSRGRQTFDVLDQNWLDADGAPDAARLRSALSDYLDQVGGPNLRD